MSVKPTYKELEQRVKELEKTEFDFKKIEQALRGSGERLRTTLDSIGDAVIATDTSGNITIMNPVAEKLTGWDFEEAKHKPVTEVFNIVNAQSKEKVENPVARVLENGKIAGLANHTMLVDKKDNRYQIADSGAPIRDAKGNITGVVLVFRDVTEEYRIQKALRERIKELTGIYNLSHIIEEKEDLQEILQGTVDLIPDSWQYPDITCAKLVIEGKLYTTQNYEDTAWRLSRDIVVDKHTIGTLKIGYLEERPQADEGPFLKDEGELITVIVERLQYLIERKQAEEKLKKSEEKSRVLYNNSPDMYISVSPDDASIILCNETLLNKTGYLREEIIGLPIFKMYHNDCMDDVKKAFQQFAQEGVIKDKELLLKRKDGTKIDVSLNINAVRDETGKILHSISSLRDISTRRRVEKEYQTLFREMLNGFSHHEIICDVQGKPVDYRFLAVNPSFERMTGLKEGDITGKTVLEIMPDTEQHWIETFGRVAITGEPASFENYSREIDKHFEVTAFQPAPNQFACIFADITERKQAEASLRESHSTFLTVLDSIEATVYAADMETYEILFMNKFMKDSFGSDFTGKTCWENFRNESGPCSNCNNDKLLDKEGNPVSVLVSNDKNPITKKWYINYDRAIKWIDGRYVKLQVAADITDLKIMEGRLRQAQKMEAIGTLAGGIAHDFNNILYAIIGYTELSMATVPEGGKTKKNLQAVLNAADRAKNMIQQILTFSRKSEKEKIPTSIQSVLKEAIKLIRVSLPSTIEIRQDIDADCDPIMADATQIHEIIMNLGTNAYHAMRETGGILGITLMQKEINPEDSKYNPDLYPGSYLKLSVEDTGCGINSDVMEKIFNPYFTTKDVDEGTGMGLSVVHGIVNDHGGDIRVYSEPGKGTAFHVYLPLIKTGTVERKIISGESVPTGTERILFVDDEEVIVNMNRQVLEDLGYQVTSRTSSVEALEAFRARPNEFDLIITDMTMPNMTGAELAPRLLEIRPDIPIILCTGFSELVDKDKAEAIGIREYVMKPIIRDEIARAIRRVLDKGEVPLVYTT